MSLALISLMQKYIHFIGFGMFRCIEIVLSRGGVSWSPSRVYFFKEEHFLLRDMVKDFAINEVRPHAKEVDTGIFPKENIDKMAIHYQLQTHFY